MKSFKVISLHFFLFHSYLIRSFKVAEHEDKHILVAKAVGDAVAVQKDTILWCDDGRGQFTRKAKDSNRSLKALCWSIAFACIPLRMIR